MEPILLSTAYFAPVHYYTRFLHHTEVYIEQYENFTKQTYRNRCNISGGNGIISLVAPVIKSRGPKMRIKDVHLSYDMDWQRNQWQTIVSAYNSSPYFEYYQDELVPFFEKKYKFLLDFNTQIHETICECLDIKKTTKLTTDFEEVPAGTLNFRDIISPKNKNLPDLAFQPHQYTQVFTEKFGFLPNLSILDLLFNEGPNADTILEQSMQFLEE